MKIRNLAGLFDEQYVLDKLTRLGDPLVLIKTHIDFNIYADSLNAAFKRSDDAKPRPGRPAYTVTTMLKILFVQRLYNLSDEQIEFQINDRMSFRRFLDIPFSDAVPDCKTVWAFREGLKREEQTELIFNTFPEQLRAKNLLAKEGKMMDATIVSIPVQRNSREENSTIKEGGVPQSFTGTPAKGRQKDTDARWTKKHNKSYYGYKNHTMAEVKNKFITSYTVTDASVHDSVPAPELIGREGQSKGEALYADSAYQTPAIKQKLAEEEMEGRIIEKAYRNKPLTEEMKAANKIMSKTRARVEHIYGFMYTSMNDGMFIRTIGKARAELMPGLNNLGVQHLPLPAIGKAGEATRGIGMPGK